MGGSAPSSAPNPYSQAQARIAREQWDNAKNLYSWAQRGENAPDWMTRPILGAGTQAIGREEARGLQAISEMAPGGMRERARSDFLQSLTSQRIGLASGVEERLREQALGAMSGAQQLAIQGLGGASASSDANRQFAAQMGYQQQKDQLDMIRQLAGSLVSIFSGKLFG